MREGSELGPAAPATVSVAARRKGATAQHHGRKQRPMKGFERTEPLPHVRGKAQRLAHREIRFAPFGNC